MSEVKLLALDIDGTILTSEKKLTARTRRALEMVINRGLAVVLVTGRPLLGIPEELLSLCGLRYLITSNGAVTTDLQNHQSRRKAVLDAVTALQIIRVPRNRDLVYAVFINGIGYCELEPFDRHLKLVHGAPIETYIRKSRRITYDMDELIKATPSGVENIWFIAHDSSERDYLSSMIAENWNVRTVKTGKVDVEVGHLLADKGLALTALAADLNLERKQILAIGDSGNDIGLLQCAGIAVAMGNAEPEVKAAADLITLSNEEDGAAVILETVLKQNVV